MQKRVMVFLLGLVLGLGLLPAQADPILDMGWAVDRIDTAFVPSLDSPYDVTLPYYTYFRITDCCAVGDQYFVYDNGALVLTTSLTGAQPALTPAGHPAGNPAWGSASLQHGEIILTPGFHSIDIAGDGVGGLPADFLTRLDNVPEPAVTILLGLGLLGLRFLRRRTD